MVSLGTIAEKIAANIARSLQMDSEKKAVMAYGIFCFSQILASILLVILFGLIFGVLAEALIISFAIAILRKYSGGAHAGTPGKCLIIGTVITIVPAIIIAHLPINILAVLCLGILIFFWAFYEVMTKAPVDSIKKPITNLQKRKRLRNGSLVILGVYLLILVLCLLGYSYSGDSGRYLQYSACILFGIAWQTFTLTKTGDHLLASLDSYINIKS